MTAEVEELTELTFTNLIESIVVGTRRLVVRFCQLNDGLIDLFNLVFTHRTSREYLLEVFQCTHTFCKVQDTKYKVLFTGFKLTLIKPFDVAVEEVIVYCVDELSV